MSNGGATNKLHGAALVAALVVLAAWLVLLGWLAIHTEIADNQWSRLITVLSSLEAVAFAAAGALFGVQIQKQRVQEAQKRADSAENRASEAEKTAAAMAEKGNALAKAVKIRAARQVAAGERLERVATTGVPPTIPDDIVALAD
jgi:hypothetical protein